MKDWKNKFSRHWLVIMGATIILRLWIRWFIHSILLQSFHRFIFSFNEFSGLGSSSVRPPDPLKLLSKRVSSRPSKWPTWLHESHSIHRWESVAFWMRSESEVCFCVNRPTLYSYYPLCSPAIYRIDAILRVWRFIFSCASINYLFIQIKMNVNTKTPGE